MAWANFDQPDLKAVHGFTVSAPDYLDGVEQLLEHRGRGPGRRWAGVDVRRYSAAIDVCHRRQRGALLRCARAAGWLRPAPLLSTVAQDLLDRDAEELFELTAQGLAWFGEKFGLPFGQERYDQVFVPDLDGAMENWGCVTWGDWALARSLPTYDERQLVAEVLLHEMAHMWFGDLVTMRWWDDLWLNEAFASWAACWAAVGATRYTDVWASFLARGKLRGYALDMGPATHPIRGDVPDVAQAMANFDSISYRKGASVLKQLCAHTGEDAFLQGLRAYFRTMPGGTPASRTSSPPSAPRADRTSTAWEKAWLDEAGTDTLTLSDGTLTAAGPDGAEPRPHRLVIGCYASTAMGCGTWRMSPYTPGADPLRWICPTVICGWSTTTTSPSPPFAPTRSLST